MTIDAMEAFFVVSEASLAPCMNIVSFALGRRARKERKFTKYVNNCGNSTPTTSDNLG